MLKRFAAIQALQLFKNVVLASFDNNYSDFEFNAASSAIAVFRMTRILLILMTIVKKKSKQRPTQMMVRVLQAALTIMYKPFSAKTNRTIVARLPPESSYKTTAAKHCYNLRGIYIIFCISIISKIPFLYFASYQTIQC